MSRTQKLTFAALMMAFYVVVMFCTQSFAFGQYQIRIATALYALAAIFPFLTVPLALANCLSNFLLGGLGILDMLGGMLAGYATCSMIVLAKKQEMPHIFIALSIALIPGLAVPVWLGIILDIPYLVLLPTVLVGQVICGIAGSILVGVVEHCLYGSGILKEAGNGDWKK